MNLMPQDFREWVRREERTGNEKLFSVCAS
jgi:hypothetical protein